MKLKFSWVAFLIGVVMIAAVLVRGIETFDDSGRYISAMQEIQGKKPIFEESTYTHAVIPLLINPATIYISTVLGWIFGSEWTGLAVLNCILYLLTILVFYNLSALLFKERRLVIIATILFGTTYSLVRFGPGSYMVDMGGWFFYILALYFATRFYFTQNERDAIYTGITSMVGLFFKEYGGIGILALLVFIMMSPGSFTRKIRLVAISCWFFIINIGFHVWSYLEKGYLYFNRYSTVVEAFAPAQTILRTVKVLGSFFSIGWPLAIWGAVRPTDIINGGKRVLWAFVPSSLIFFTYPAYDQRICFVAVPLLSFLATLGIVRISSRSVQYVILGLYVLANFFMPTILIKFNLDALLNLIG